MADEKAVAPQTETVAALKRKIANLVREFHSETNLIVVAIEMDVRKEPIHYEGKHRNMVVDASVKRLTVETPDGYTISV